MASGGRRVEAYYERDMLRIRSTLHLAVRLAVRLNQFLPASGAASPGTGPWRVALPAFMVLDVVIWRALRRDDRFGLSWRLPLDAFDAAFWTASPHPASGHYDWAVLIAVPLGIETGVRLGWRGMVLPAAVFLSTTPAAVATGKAIRPTGVFWVALAVAMGTAFLRYCRHLDRRAEQQRQVAVAAARRRAYLGGQNQVAMGASSAVDAIEGLVPVLGRPEPGSALWRLADGWKSQLNASTTQEARYLQVALLEWERGHNRHPDLSGLVRVHVGEGQGTTLLTAGQARALGLALDELDLRGTVVVRLRDPGAARLPGQVLRLEVNGHPLVVAADRGANPRPFDPCAVTYFYLVILMLASIDHDLGGMPPLLAAVGAAVCAVAGIVSHRWTVTRGERVRLAVYGVAVATGTVLTVLTESFRAPVTADGDPILGFGTSLLLLSFLGGFYWRSLGRRRWIVPAAVIGNVALGLLAYPVPGALTARALIASLAYNLMPFFPCRHLAMSLDRAAARHATSRRARDDAEERAAFLDGRDSVVELVRQARDDAVGQLRLLAPRLDPEIADLAAHRLKEVNRRLQSIESERVSLSSTTTS